MMTTVTAAAAAATITRTTRFLVRVTMHALCAVAEICSAGDVQCPGGSGVCIVEEQLCDGNNDCGDNSDEDEQFCDEYGQSILT